MLVVIIACLVGLVVVIVALAHDEPPPARRPRAGTLLAPTGAARARFPLVASEGYDPAVVEAYLDAVARALAEVLAIAPPEVVERARRLGLLLGPDPDASDRGAPDEEPVVAKPAQTPARSSTLDGADLATGLDTEDGEALRAEAALAAIECRGLPFP